MEFTLNNKTLEYMDAVYRNSLTHEVATESIIPDSLPDAQRVIETEARVCIRSKDAEDGRVTVKGVVDASVIYADEEGRIKKTEISLPVDVALENGSIVRDAKTVVAIRIASADTRLLNPRKMFVRCDVLLDVACYGPVTVQLWLPPENAKDSEIELLTQEREVRVLTDVSEKTFVITEEYNLPPAKPAVGEVLKTKVDIEIEEAKGVGNKVILKGVAKVCVMYRPERGGEPVNVEFSTVFSQIMELGTQSNGLEFKASLVPTSVYVNTGGLFASEDRRVALEVHALAQCLAYRNENVTCICDAYCCKYEISTQQAGVEIDSLEGESETVEPVREIISAVRQPGSIIGTSILPGTVYKTRTDDKLELTATAVVSILYLSEDGIILSASKKLSIASALTAAPDVEHTVSAYVQGEPSAMISTDGIEIKFSLALKSENRRMIKMNGLSAIDIDTDAPKDLSKLPSIVLKRYVKGDTLWILAKKYSSVRELILAANGLEPGAEPELNSMLIIPKKR